MDRMIDFSWFLMKLSLLVGWEEENKENVEYEENSRGHPEALPYLNQTEDRQEQFFL